MIGHSATYAAAPRLLLRSLCNLAVLLAFAGLVTLRGPAGPGTMGTLLALLGLVLLLRERRLTADDLRIAALLLALPACYAANLLLTGWDLAQLDKPGRLVFGFLVYFALSRVGLDARYLHWGSIAGALAAAALAAWQVHGLGHERANGAMNAIPFGNDALLLGFFAAAGWLATPPGGRSRALGWACVAAVAAALYASLASGTRGGWVAIPALLWVLSLAAGGQRPGLRLAVCAGGVALLALALAAVPALGARTLAEFDNLRQLWLAAPDEVATMPLSSIGTRIHLYHVGIDAFLAHPLLGIGFAGLPDWLAAGAAAGTVNPAVVNYTHLHSAPVDMAARGGLLGLAALAFFVFGLLRHFAHALAAATDADSRYFALAGLLAIAGAALFSLTNVFFPAIVGTNILVLTLVVPAGALAHLRRQAALTAEDGR